jgi:Tfp pilus assembly protein PilN
MHRARATSPGIAVPAAATTPQARRSSRVGRLALHGVLAAAWAGGIFLGLTELSARVQAQKATLADRAAEELDRVQLSLVRAERSRRTYTRDRAWRETTLAAARRADGQRIPPLTLIVNEAARRRPSGVWLSRIAVRNGAVRIVGSALAEDSVTAYLQRLSTSPYIDDATLGSLTRGGTDLVPRFDFTITGRVASEG